MTAIPIPNRCVWCLRSAPEVSFDLSHVFPECVGNANQQVLPAGVVCKGCNQYFGSKIEPILLDDPIFHTIAVTLNIVDPDDMNLFRSKVFDQTHQPLESPKRSLHLDVNVGDQELTVGATYTIQGRIAKKYTTRELSLLSRAVHKIGFEALAWAHFVKGVKEELDLFSTRFQPVRAWAREGQPPSSVRPVLRCMGGELSPKFEVELWEWGSAIGTQFSFFGDWYAVSLTSSHSQAPSDLRAWTPPQKDGVWYISNTMSALR